VGRRFNDIDYRFSFESRRLRAWRQEKMANKRADERTIAVAKPRAPINIARRERFLEALRHRRHRRHRRTSVAHGQRLHATDWCAALLWRGGDGIVPSRAAAMQRNNA
jgi:hypothetical protein